MNVSVYTTVLIAQELTYLEVSSVMPANDVASVTYKICVTLIALVPCHGAFGTELAQNVVVSAEDSKVEVVSGDEFIVFDSITQQLLS